MKSIIIVVSIFFFIALCKADNYLNQCLENSPGHEEEAIENLLDVIIIKKKRDKNIIFLNDTIFRKSIKRYVNVLQIIQIQNFI